MTRVSIFGGLWKEKKTNKILGRTILLYNTVLFLFQVSNRRLLKAVNFYDHNGIWHIRQLERFDLSAEGYYWLQSHFTSHGSQSPHCFRKTKKNIK